MKESVVLVGVALKGEENAMLRSVEELRRLTETAGGAVVDTLTQRMDRYHAGLLIGQGKAEEIGASARLHKARTVIFDEDLSPTQQKELERVIGAKVLDRTRLILDIFAQRARTREGELQVELAQLSYLLPRLTGSWRGYSQQVGGIGTRGPGERKLEYERRHINRRIEYLKRDIAKLERERAVQRRRRRSVPVPQVALMGYTNVGKSSLLNALTGEREVYADDKLFATLDPTTRRVKLPEGGFVVATDTVGFIQKLPTPLIAAFRSTLEEVAQADCLVHVIDASAPDREEQVRSVGEVLSDLKADGVPRVEALNKMDLLGKRERDAAKRLYPKAVPLSATRGEGLTALLEAVQDALHERWVLRELDLPPDRTGAIQEAYQSAQVLSQTFAGGKIRLRLRVTPENWKRLLNKSLSPS